VGKPVSNVLEGNGDIEGAGDGTDDGDEGEDPSLGLERGEGGGRLGNHEGDDGLHVDFSGSGNVLADIRDGRSIA